MLMFWRRSLDCGYVPMLCVHSDTCVYGDYRVPLYIDHDVPLMTCSEAAVKYPSKCYDSYHANHCCDSCVKAAQTDKPGGPSS